MARRKPVTNECGICKQPCEFGKGSYSLIDAGWRLITVKEPDGGEAVEWRCAHCFDLERAEPDVS